MTNINLNIYKDLVKDVLDQMNFRDLCELGERFHFEGSYDAECYAGKKIDGNPDESELKAEIVSNYLDDNYSIRGSAYLNKNHSDGFEDAHHPLLDDKCEKCSNPTKGFTLNLCEDCFDKATDEYYDGGLIDEEDE